MDKLGQAGEGPQAVPTRPKAMRLATFERLWALWLREEERRIAAIREFIAIQTIE
jgi:hypothetical protein